MMKSITATLALAITTATAVPVFAQELFPQPVLASDALAGLNAVHTTATNSLFAQTSVSVGSVAVATMLPGAATATETQSSDQATYTSPWGPQLVYDVSGDPVYLATGTSVTDGACFSNCVYGYTATGKIIIGDFAMPVRYSTDDVVSPEVVSSGGGTTLSGVQALTNLSGSALNSLTVTSDSVGIDQNIAGFATQLAIADGSSSTANLTIPNVTAGMATMSNTALGAVNTISVNIGNVAIAN